MDAPMLGQRREHSGADSLGTDSLWRIAVGPSIASDIAIDEVPTAQHSSSKSANTALPRRWVSSAIPWLASVCLTPHLQHSTCSVTGNLVIITTISYANRQSSQAHSTSVDILRLQ
jgi:hypothetical protein